MIKTSGRRQVGEGGFSVVELIVTLVVAALLVVVTITTISAYSKRAHRVEYQAAVTAYVRAQQAYYQDAKRFYQKYPGFLSEELIGWNASDRPDQPDRYRYPALGVEFPRESRFGFCIQVYDIRRPDLYWQRLYVRLRTAVDLDSQPPEQDLYAYDKENCQTSADWGTSSGWNTNGEWVVRNDFWFDLQGCPPFSVCR
jgi:type II secretory pathway pseudopilin PulG